MFPEEHQVPNSCTSDLLSYVDPTVVASEKKVSSMVLPQIKEVALSCIFNQPFSINHFICLVKQNSSPINVLAIKFAVSKMFQAALYALRSSFFSVTISSTTSFIGAK